MFFKFIRFDIKNGVLKQYKAVILTFLFSFLAAGLHALSLRAYELVHPEYLNIQPTIGDFMITIFAGCRENAAQEMGMSFQVPVDGIHMLDASAYAEISSGRTGRNRQTAFDPFTQAKLLVFLKMHLGLCLYNSFICCYVFGYNCNGVTLRGKSLF